ncbi:MAG TPA: 2-oxoglutarate and iron-dependent oxygenase domain-containing protein [Steroidobacteraceae bacterium]|jgi:isopenicillin N synthase-like dioxygenase|nr:2-oxoglutarate and iron-dependent oxygenase domain-containing protein [Steroidobacteraceae bacterium]
MPEASIPIVDISALYGSDASARFATAQQLGEAARSAGVLYVTGHGLAPALFDELLLQTKRFFALPIEQKMQVYIGRSRNHRGYVPQGEEVFAGGTKDVKEAYDLARDLPTDDPDYLSGVPLLGPNQWPEDPAFKSAISGYYEAAFAVGRALIGGFAQALGEAADFFERHLRKPPSQLRLIHYPFDPDAADAPGIGAHTDYECFTLLRGTSPGLEILNEKGLWIDAPPVEDAFVVNIGDMFELWTNGEFVATSHRVRKVCAERYSFPLFFSVDYHTCIEPMARFVTSHRPARPGVVAGEHLFAQTAQTFTYLRQRLERGELTLPQSSAALSSFGQQAKLGVR